MIETQKPIPGAVVIEGVQYLRNAQGDLTAVGNIKPMDLLMDEMALAMRDAMLALGGAADVEEDLIRDLQAQHRLPAAEAGPQAAE